VQAAYGGIVNKRRGWIVNNFLVRSLHVLCKLYKGSFVILFLFLRIPRLLGASHISVELVPQDLVDSILVDLALIEEINKFVRLPMLLYDLSGLDYLGLPKQGVVFLLGKINTLPGPPHVVHGLVY
jgi:hypothetical protein